MAGLGELLSTLLGGQKAAGDGAKDADTLARVAAGVGDSLAKTPGSPFQMVDWAARANSLLANRDAVAEALKTGDVTSAIERSGVLSAEAAQTTLDAVKGITDALAGRTAQSQLEAILGVKIPDEATTTRAVMEQLALLTQANEAIQAVSVASEVASIGQIDRLGAEMRSYLDYSGLSQISGFGYGQILGTVIGARMNQELLSVTRPAIPSVLDLATMRMRETITPDDYLSFMAKLGYPDVISENLYKTARFYPNPQDWIRFAVRDVFNPEVAEAGGLYEQFPAEIVPYAEKGGVSEELMRMFWAAHWNLPSPNQAYEMLHRGLISLDELKALLRAADYAPGYVDAMVNIAYQPYTRVDARNMLKMGVLDDAGFIKAMKDIGYDDEHAENLLKFAKMGDTGNDKDLTQSQMMKAYSIGKLGRSDLNAYLINMGYDESEAALLIDLEDAKKADDLLKETIAVLDWEYVRGDITDSEYLDAMGKEGIPREKATYYLSLAALEAQKSVKLPTKAEVEKWYKKDYITASDALKYLRQMGYRESETNLYMREWDDEKGAQG